MHSHPHTATLLHGLKPALAARWYLNSAYHALDYAADANQLPTNASKAHEHLTQALNLVDKSIDAGEQTWPEEAIGQTQQAHDLLNQKWTDPTFMGDLIKARVTCDYALNALGKSRSTDLPHRPYHDLSLDQLNRNYSAYTASLEDLENCYHPDYERGCALTALNLLRAETDHRKQHNTAINLLNDAFDRLNNAAVNKELPTQATTARQHIADALRSDILDTLKHATLANDTLTTITQTAHANLHPDIRAAHALTNVATEKLDTSNRHPLFAQPEPNTASELLKKAQQHLQLSEIDPDEIPKVKEALQHISAASDDLAKTPHSTQSTRAANRIQDAYDLLSNMTFGVVVDNHGVENVIPVDDHLREAAALCYTATNQLTTQISSSPEPQRIYRNPDQKPEKKEPDRDDRER